MTKILSTDDSNYKKNAKFAVTINYHLTGVLSLVYMSQGWTFLLLNRNRKYLYGVQITIQKYYNVFVESTLIFNVFIYAHLL